ncbi:MAG: 2'-5' RNA ligase family protein [Lunatimonas sp.]|uniref:2'-5' RNA ligase family protein n=1 Tax=Lunatimonas sp. TaxID=2060141 RepID=UPI00263B667B|nr:2'-5' RNA ligase family protein [Lunatimonas sp.]MCC5938444.1 2'-5' RNA ligase family protein [Lunatimonas sp.]
MAKKMEKYFLALVPRGRVQELAEGVKAALKERFGVKYALKSPAHVTVKMPFLWNENKEEELKRILGSFAADHAPFALILKGFGHFRQRIIFIHVWPQQRLDELQAALRELSKVKLKLDVELSDQNFRPHMTVAYNDLKKKDFQDCFEYVRSLGFDQRMQVEDLALLKKREGRWEVLTRFPLGKTEA